MRNWKLIVFMGMVLCATAFYLRSQPQKFQRNTTVMLLPRLTLKADPASIPAGQSTSVTFSAQLVGPVARQVQLLRAGPDGAFIAAGTFQSTGNGGFSLQLPVGQATAGTIGFAAQAMVPGAAAAYAAMRSNTVQISVVQAPSPPAVQIVGAKLIPNGIVQGQSAAITVEASISTRRALQVILRRVDTNATLATLSPVPAGIAATTYVSTFMVYTASFNLVATDQGVMPLQIVATGPTLTAPLIAGLSLSVAAAPQTSPPANPASRGFPRIGLSLAIPPGWRVNQDVYDSGGPIALDNFGSNYGQSPDGQFCCGGVIPMNGATIDVSSESTNGNTVQALAQNELKGAENTAFEQIQLAGGAATRARYDDTYTPALRYNSIAVYAGQGSLVYKFYLSYRAGDPRAADFSSAFQSLLDSVQFTKEQ